MKDLLAKGMGLDKIDGKYYLYDISSDSLTEYIWNPTKKMFKKAEDDKSREKSNHQSKRLST